MPIPLEVPPSPGTVLYNLYSSTTECHDRLVITLTCTLPYSLHHLPSSPTNLIYHHALFSIRKLNLASLLFLSLSYPKQSLPIRAAGFCRRPIITHTARYLPWDRDYFPPSRLLVPPRPPFVDSPAHLFNIIGPSLLGVFVLLGPGPGPGPVQSGF